MQLDRDSVFLTAHHTRPRDESIVAVDKSELFEDADENTPVLFFAGRLSKEKGVFDLPEIYQKVREVIPDIRLVIAGTGPAEAALKEQLPEAHFTGWLDKVQIAQLYKGLDLFVFPSRFDTFGNVILEAMVYGMPAIAYNCKGPKDIIRHNDCGYLVEDIDRMCDSIIGHFGSETHRKQMSNRAMLRSDEFQATPIMQRFLSDMGLDIDREPGLAHDSMGHTATPGISTHEQTNQNPSVEPVQQRSVA
jgi:glycosyltransferase involved in cell wall biosynthesis